MEIALIIIAIAAAVVFGAGGFIGGFFIKKQGMKDHEAEAQAQAAKIIEDAKKEADSVKKEAIIQGKEEVHKLRENVEKEQQENRKEAQRLEKRYQQREEKLERSLEATARKEEQYNSKLRQADKKLEEIEKLKDDQLEKLKEISGYTTEQAKQYLLDKLDGELTHEKASKIIEFREKLHEEAENEAREVIAQAIQRFAAEHTSDATVAVVDLPNDEMKGRIIGREGRNIRSIETLAGVDLIINDTPEAITVSCFDPVRREIAKIALEKLVADGRIHPTRIEEMLERAKKEVEHSIKQYGEKAIIDLGINGMHPELVKLLGRLHYRTSYGQNVLEHSVEVAQLCGIMASELGIDVEKAKRAGLLHDIGKGLDFEQEGSHVQIGVEQARRYKESEDIIHAIEAHHGDVEPRTVLAFIVQAGDAISAARPGARRENLENYIKRLEKLEETASSFKGVDSCYAIQAGREIRIMVNPEEITDDEMVILARDICKKIENELVYPGQIKVNIVRESRVVDYAE